MYKYYDEDGKYVIGYKEGNKVIVDSEVFTEYEMVWNDARYIRINGNKYIREDFIKTQQEPI